MDSWIYPALERLGGHGLHTRPELRYPPLDPPGVSDGNSVSLKISPTSKARTVRAFSHKLTFSWPIFILNSNPSLSITRH